MRRFSSVGSWAGSVAVKPEQLVQREGGDLGDGAVAEPGAQRLRAQPGAVTHRADARDDKPLHEPSGALVVAAQGAFHRGHGVVVVDRQLNRATVASAQGHGLAYRFAVQHRVALALGQRPVRHVEPYTQLSRGVHRQPPPARVPRQDGAVLDRLRGVGDQRLSVHFGPYAQALARRTGTVRVERERLGARVLEPRPAHGAGDLLGECGDRRVDPVAVRAQVRAQARHHEAHDVEHFRHGDDGAARAGYRRALPQRQRGRQVVDAVHVRTLCLGQPSAAVGAQTLQKPLHALGVQRPDRQRRLARPGYTDHRDRAPQRDVDVEVAEVVVPSSVHANGSRQVIQLRRRSHQSAGSASDLVTARPRPPCSCRSPKDSMRMDWSRPPTRIGS